MDIKFTLEKIEKNWLKRTIQNIKKFLLDSPYEKHTISVCLFNESSLGDIDRVLKNAIEEGKKAEQTKAKDHELIKKLLKE